MCKAKILSDNLPKKLQESAKEAFLVGGSSRLEALGTHEAHGARACLPANSQKRRLILHCDIVRLLGWCRLHCWFGFCFRLCL